MKKTLITLAALVAASLSAGAATIGEWNFENTTNATAGGVNGEVRTYSEGKQVTTTATYVNSLSQGTALGSYFVANDMGYAVKLSTVKDSDTSAESWISLSNTKYKDALDMSKSFTLGAYVNFSSFEGEMICIFSTGSGTGSGFSFGIGNADNGYQFDFLSKGKSHYYTGVIDGLSADTWQHVAVSYSAGATKQVDIGDIYDEAGNKTGDQYKTVYSGIATWYLNGTAVATQTFSDVDFAVPGGEGSAIGSNGQDVTSMCTGSISLDHVQVFDSALDATSIRREAGLIPEPATSALSLLALAGLAARRRRK